VREGLLVHPKEHLIAATGRKAVRRGEMGRGYRSPGPTPTGGRPVTSSGLSGPLDSAFRRRRASRGRPPKSVVVDASVT
jgi:hypothetical protein